jgi:SOS-response transcriptional repressor LexA
MNKVRGKRPMTPKMLKLLQFIKKYIELNKYSPTFEEMAKEMGYKSKNSVSVLLEKLEQRNEIKRDYAGYSRNIDLNG